MRSDCILDTNVLVYGALGKKDEPRKYAAAKRLIATELFGLSGQVLAEFYVNVTRRPETALATAEVDDWMELLNRYPVVHVDAALVADGIRLARRYKVHSYDAALIAAAERLGVDVLYTEDLNHGQRYGTVLVQNPFRAS